MESSRRKTTRCTSKNKKESKRKKAKVSGKRTNQNHRTNDISNSLPYDVLRIIFKHLNGMDLSSASVVCRTWLKAAVDEKRTRGPVYFVDVYDELCLSTRPKVKPCCFRKQVIKDLRIKPSFGIFMQSEWRHEEDCHAEILPPNCYTVTLNTFGVVLNNKEYEKNPEDEYAYGSTAWAFLPEIRGVTIETFVLPFPTFSESTPCQNHIDSFTHNLKEALAKPTATDAKSRCLLVFSKRYDPTIGKILRSVKRRFPDGPVSVWGGIVSGIGVHCRDCLDLDFVCTPSAYCVGIVITGSLQTWSIIVDKSHETGEQVERRLMVLKNCVQLKRHSMGFMFACFARGYSKYDEHDIEATIFKKLFPKVPLIGCFGNGELGTNTIVDESARKKAPLYNEMSTVFLVPKIFLPPKPSHYLQYLKRLP